MFAVVSARRGPTILMPRTLLRVDPDATIAELFERALQSPAWTCAGGSVAIDDVIGARLHSVVVECQTATDGQSINTESLDMPISVGLQMGFKGIEFKLAEGTGLSPGTSLSGQSGRRSAFDVLMTRAVEYELPPKREVNNAFHRLQNDVIDWMQACGAGWAPSGMDSGLKTVQGLSGALWYIQHQHDKFRAQGAGIPETFHSFQGMFGTAIQITIKSSL